MSAVGRPLRRAGRVSGVRLVVGVLLLAGLAGCGREELWSRWRAERDFWRAQREIDRVLVRPRVAKPADYARAETRFRRIVETFPASRWARKGGNATEREVAEISARSALALARLDDMRDRVEPALAGYQRVESEWRTVEDVALDAAVFRAAALASRDREEEARAAWEHVAHTYPVLDPASGEPRRGALQAARALARDDAERGRLAERDSIVHAVSTSLAEALGRARSAPARVALADRIAEFRELGGDLDGSLDAGRAALLAGTNLPETERARRILALGERSLAAGRPDSARRYARWGAEAFGGRDRFAALLLDARALEAEGLADSSLDAYARLLSEFPRLDGAADARFERAVILERLDRWPLARAEYSALCAAFPSHPRALEAWERVVRHHRAAGEDELARIEADHALGALDDLIQMQHDPGERARVVEARAAVLLAAGRAEPGIRELQALWASVGISARGARIGMIAADEADRTLKDRALARRLWQILSRRSPDPEVRRRAAAALETRPS